MDDIEEKPFRNFLNRKRTFEKSDCLNLNIKLTAVFEEAEEGGYVAFIEEIPGVNTQGESLEEARINLAEALQMVLDANRKLSPRHENSKSIIREDLLLAS